MLVEDGKIMTEDIINMQEKEEYDLSTEERQKLVKRLLDNHVINKSELRELTAHLGGFEDNFFESFQNTKNDSECEWSHCPICNSCPESDYPGLEITELDPSDEERLQRPSLTDEQLENDDKYVFYLIECHVCGFKERKWSIEPKI